MWCVFPSKTIRNIHNQLLINIFTTLECLLRQHPIFQYWKKKNVALQRCYEFVTCSLVILYIKRGKLYILWVWRASKSTQHFVQVYFGTQKFDNTYHLCQQPSGKGGRSSRLMLIFSPFKSLRRLMLLNLGNICTIIVVIF